MTSKISLFKLIKYDLKNRAWLTALLGIVFFAAQPIQLILGLGQERRYEAMYVGYPENYVPQYDLVVERLMGPSNDVLFLLILGAALLCAFSGFYYVQSRSQLDFYHSLPMTRLQLYRVYYFSGVLMFVISFTIGTLLSWGIIAVNELMSGAQLFAAVQMYVISLFQFFAIYGLSILAIMLTGRIVATVAALLVMSVYPVLILSIYQSFLERYFKTYVYLSAEASMQSGMSSQLMAELFSPLELRNGLVFAFPIGLDVGVRGWLLLLFLVLQAVLFNVLAAHLYKIRKTEAVNHVLAFPKMEAAIKLLIVIPISLRVALNVSGYFEGDEGWAFMIACLLVVILLSFAAEFCYHIDIRWCLNRKWCIPLSFGVCTLIFLGCKFDWMGYDSYLPAKNQLESMSFCYGNINGSFSYKMVENDGNGNSTYYSDYFGMDRMEIFDFEPLYRLAEEGIVQLDNENLWNDVQEDAGILSLKYTLKNGKEVYRQYKMENQLIEDQLKTVLSDSQIRTQMYPIFQWENKRVYSVSMMDISEESHGEILNVSIKSHTKEFLDVYRQELLTADYEDLDTSRYQLDIALDADSYIEDSFYGYPMGEGFPKTMKLLKSLE